MKKILLIVALIAASVALYAQENVTKFLGIPVDGTKEEMVRKLNQKGFVSDPYSEDLLKGEFNGRSVNISIVTNKGKVWRIMVYDAYRTDERNIKQRFNKLYEQFNNNGKYMLASFSDCSIPDDEDISYEMSVNNKRYEAPFYQLPEDYDETTLMEEMQSNILSKYTVEELAELTEEERNNLIITASFMYIVDKYSNNSVWFMISEAYGQYFIVIYYDNELNRAHGEDL